LAKARRNNTVVAVLMLDMDNFKVVNDSVGHVEGDRLLRIVGERLVSAVRDSDTVARTGGDEFALLLPAISRAEEAAAIAERVLEDCRHPWALDGREFHVGASIGIALYPRDGENGDSLRRNADIAMYRAKAVGGNAYEFFAPIMQAQIEDRLAMEGDLRRALERGEFMVHYQPQLDMDSEHIVGVEALMRWRCPDRGLVSPEEFIPVAEQSGLIVPMGEWVLRNACAQNRAWQEAGLPPMRVAVNMSPRQFQQRDLAEMVARVLEETRLAPEYVDLEITESIVMENVAENVATLRELAGMGINITIDDFGMGHSALAYLKDFPVGALKIDRLFVAGLPTDGSSAAIAAAIVNVAHSLNLRVVAEGVETEEQRTFLTQRRCEEFQGYLFSRPVPAEAIGEMLSRIKNPRRRSASRVAT
jgi:diguanylate cyclase (GGDEF)-like protein